MGARRLSSTKQRRFKGDIYGFDIETYGDKNKFLCASIVGDKESWIFRDKQKLLDFFKTKRFWNSLIVATNLGFDYFGLFGKDTPESKDFYTLFQGSGLILSQSYIHGQKFNKKYIKGKGYRKIMFIDTMNYMKASVKVLGDILGIPKLEQPKAFMRKPKNEAEWQEMIEYNIRDSEISKKFFEFLMEDFYKLGASFKPTIAGVSMSIFRNKYVKHDSFGLSVEDTLEHFKGYYGGHTENFSRGNFKNINYYDVNSLYPSCMKDHIFPDPNFHRVTYKNTLEYIQNFEGISEVTVSCPCMEFPLLPYRSKELNKLIFPTGEFTSWQSHVELRQALKLGYKILKVHKTHYYKETCKPFDDYVNVHYDLKKKYTREKDKRVIVAKLLLNSLYGKFAQKFLDRDNWETCTQTKEELEKLKDFEIVGEYIRTKQDSEPAGFCLPIWSIYITAYSRLKMHGYFLKCKPLYCDTDSLMTTQTLPTSEELGELKLEYRFKELHLVKPKMYGAVREDGKKLVKTKGVGKQLSYEEFMTIINSDDPTVFYTKLVKFKEAVRRNFEINEAIEQEKHLTLEDNKRIWKAPYNPKAQQHGTPIKINESI